eukprot:g47164.t1
MQSLFLSLAAFGAGLVSTGFCLSLAAFGLMSYLQNRRQARLRQTPTHYSSPYRALPIHCLNQLGRLAEKLLGVSVALDESSLIWAAVHRADLPIHLKPSCQQPPSFISSAVLALRKVRAIFGWKVEADILDANPLAKEAIGPVLEPLRLLLADLEVSGLPPFGRFMQRERLINILAHRIRAQAFFAQFPEIDDEELLPPVVILGLPRTGTTMLHRLLASDTRNFLSLPAWESMNPVPYEYRRLQQDELASGRADAARFKEAQATEAFFALAAPHWPAIHDAAPLEIEEDVMLMELSLLSYVSPSCVSCPRFSTWLETADVSPSYRYMARLLKLIQWYRAGDYSPRPWLLKTPDHLHFLPHLLKIFKDARLIVCHRDPAVALASFCSMVAHTQGLFSDKVDVLETGSAWCRKFASALSTLTDIRDYDNSIPGKGEARYELRSGSAGSGAGKRKASSIQRDSETNMQENRTRAVQKQGQDQARWHDILYANMMVEPLQQAKGIYAWLGLPWTEASETALYQHMAASTHKRKHKTRHVYNLKSFGLDYEQVKLVTKKYTQRFKVKLEPIN